MRVYQFRHWLFHQVPMKLRLQTVVFWYLLALMVESRKHSLTFAATLSGLQASQFSRLLRRHKNIAVYSLDELGRKQAKRYAPLLKDMEGLPWKIGILIDATLQTRAGLHTENAHRFNHGQGFVIGHQWTNIVLLLNGVLIPLPPLPFYSKNYCKAHHLPYHTEHARLREYLTSLNLEAYIGPHCAEEVVVLMDSGYDNKALQQTILTQHWQLLGALKSTRTVKSLTQVATTPKATHWTQIAQFFKDQRRLAWETVCLPTHRPKQTRMEFRIRQTRGYLKGVGLVQLVCSEPTRRRHGRRKYLACSDLRVTPKQILMGYRLRWQIEIFHKQIKQHLGFEDVAPTAFCSVETHVALVYCAYLLFQMPLPGLFAPTATLLDKQTALKQMLDNQEKAHILQRLTQFGGTQKYLHELKTVLSPQ